METDLNGGNLFKLYFNAKFKYFLHLMDGL